jgi:hypothetical protein
MNKPYWNGPGGHGGGRRFAGEYRSGHPGDDGRHTGDHDSRYGYGRTATDTYDPPDPYGDYQDHEDYQDYHDGTDTGWRWIAGLAGVVLLIVVVAIAVVMRAGGDTATTSSPSPQISAGSGADPATSTAPRTVVATAAPSPPVSATPLPPETVVTITPTPSAETPPPAPPVPAETAPPAQTITYTVTGSRSLFDLVTIIYSDEQGFPRTDINVALPWTRTVVLNPGVQTKSVTATSLTGQLNCSITDAAGAVIAVQNGGSAVAAC